MALNSEVAIVNSALLKLGQQPITSLTDNNIRANTASHLYPDVRDAVMTTHAWNCATKRALLSEEAVTEVYGPTHTYQLPADFLRLVRVEEDTEFRIEANNRIVSDESPLRITYLARITDPAKMDELLKRAIAFRLAAEMAPRLTGSDARAQQMFGMYQEALDEARLRDAQQAPSVDDINPSEWIEARYRPGTWTGLFSTEP